MAVIVDAAPTSPEQSAESREEEHECHEGADTSDTTYSEGSEIGKEESESGEASSDSTVTGPAEFEGDENDSDVEKSEGQDNEDYFEGEEDQEIEPGIAALEQEFPVLAAAMTRRPTAPLNWKAVLNYEIGNAGVACESYAETSDSAEDGSFGDEIAEDSEGDDDEDEDGDGEDQCLFDEFPAVEYGDNYVEEEEEEDSTLEGDIMKRESDYTEAEDVLV